MTPGERRAGMLWAVAAVAAAATQACAWLPPSLAALLLTVTFLLTPGALAARALLRAGDALPREAVALAWSPFLVGGAMAALAALGMPFRSAVRLTALGIALLAAAHAVRPGVRLLPGSPRSDLLVALAWAAVVAALLIGVPTLALRSDGWFHAAVTLQIVERGIVPEDPYFAGMRLLYFWGEHAWAAGWLVLAPRLPASVPLLAGNIAAAFAVALAVAAMARRLGGDARAARLAVALMVAGYAPFAWVQVMGRALVGEVRGWTEITRLAGTGADAVLDLLGRGLLHASLVFFGDKYLVVTPFAMGLALLLLATLALLDIAERAELRRCAVLGLTVSAMLFVHSVVGYSFVLMVAAWWVWSAVEAVRGDSAARARLIPLALTIALACIAVAPYLYVTALGKEGQLRTGFTMGALRSALLGGAAIVPAALLWLASRAQRLPASRVLLLGASVLLVAGLAMRLPENNQSKFFNLLWLLLAAPAALAWLDWSANWSAPGRVALGAVASVALLPTVVFSLWAFALERGQSTSTVRASTPQELEGIAWLKSRTPADVVLCDLGGARDLLTLAGRSVAWGGPGGERDWGYPPAALAVRRQAVRSLCLGDEPSSEARAWLSTLTRPLLVVARANAPDSLSGWHRLPMSPERFRPAFRNDEIAFYRWEGAR